MSKHYLYINDDGDPESIDIDTGEIIKSLVRKEDLYKYRPLLVNGKQRWVPLVDIPTPKKYSILLADQMCTMILEGVGIQRACDKIGITYREYVQWRKAYPEFMEMMDEARKDRAEIFFEKLEEVAEQTEANEDDISLGRLKIDVYKHLSEVSDSSRFGKTTKINAKVGVGAIQIETGIRRPGDPGFTEARLFEEIEQSQKVIAEEDLNVIPINQPTHLPKKVE